MSIAGIFALGGGCYDNDKYHRKGRRYSSYKNDYDHGTAMVTAVATSVTTATTMTTTTAC